MASKSTAFLRWRSFVSLDLNSSFYYHVIALVTVGVINITCIVNGFRPGSLPKSDAVKYGIKDSSPVRVKVALCWDVKKGYFIFCCWESTSIYALDPYSTEPYSSHPVFHRITSSPKWFSFPIFNRKFFSSLPMCSLVPGACGGSPRLICNKVFSDQEIKNNQNLTMQ